jgi:hypothetical protein
MRYRAIERAYLAELAYFLSGQKEQRKGGKGGKESSKPAAGVWVGNVW